MISFAGSILLSASHPKNTLNFPVAVGSNKLFSSLFNAFNGSNSHCNGSNEYRNYSSTAEGIKGIRKQPTSTTSINGVSNHTSPRGHMRSISSFSDTKESESGWRSWDARSNHFTNKNFAIFDYVTCEKSRKFTCSAELAYYAMKWFDCAKEVYMQAGDDLSAARAASRIARCHLQTLFVPVTLQGIPFGEAASMEGPPPPISSVSEVVMTKGAHDGNRVQHNITNPNSLGSTFVKACTSLSACLADEESLSGHSMRTHITTDGKTKDSISRDKEMNVSTGKSRRKKSRGQESDYDWMTTTGSIAAPRVASLEWVAKELATALEVCAKTCFPLPLIETYLDMAELRLLQVELIHIFKLIHH